MVRELGFNDIWEYHENWALMVQELELGSNRSPMVWESGFISMGIRFKWYENWDKVSHICPGW